MTPRSPWVVCEVCGAMVADRALHAAYHRPPPEPEPCPEPEPETEPEPDPESEPGPEPAPDLPEPEEFD